MTFKSTTVFDRSSTRTQTNDLSIPKNAVRRTRRKSFTDGDGDNLANEQWEDRRVLTAGSGTDDLDLSGVLPNFLGTTIAFTKIKEIYIINLGVPTVQQSAIAQAPDSSFTPTAGESLKIGAAAANPWTQLFDGQAAAELVIPSGGEFWWRAPLSAGLAVTAGSSDVLRVLYAGSGSLLVYDIFIAGVV